MKCRILGMKIIYSNGTMREALLLSRTENTLRAAVAGRNDALTFTFAHDTWLSEEWEPVQIEFAWGHTGRLNVPSESDFTCSTNLSSRCLSLARTALVSVLTH